MSTTRINTELKKGLLKFFVRAQPYFLDTKDYGEYCRLYEQLKPKKPGRKFGYRKYPQEKTQDEKKFMNSGGLYSGS